MNLLDTLIPSFVPDVSKAKKVIGKASCMAFKNAKSPKQEPLTIRILRELKEFSATSPEIAACLEGNLKSVASTCCSVKKSGYATSKFIRSESNQEMALYSITEKGLKHLTEFDQRHWRGNETLPNVSGIPSFVELESLYVVEKAQVSASS